MSKEQKIDPVTLEIIRHGLNAIPNHIDTNLTRTAYSPLVYEYKDYAVGIVDPEGRLISQCKGGIPIFVANALGVAVLDGIEIYGADGFAKGDVVISNHADTLGQHLNNVVMYTPVFHPGDGHGADGSQELVGFMAVVVHWLDVGGLNLGSCHASDTTEVFQEGIQFRTVKLLSKGRRVEEIYRVIEYNTRFPKMVLGDLEAQVAGCLMGRDMLCELVAKYGLATVRKAIEVNWDQSERIARAAISALTDGEYRASSFFDSDGIDPERTVPIEIIVRIAGDEMTVDFSEIADQVVGAMNSGRNGGAVAAARVAGKYLLTPDEPANEGDFRPIKVIIPEGKLLSARPGAAIGQSGTTLPTIIDTIFKAMAPAMPERVSAAHHGTYGIHVFFGHHPRSGALFSHVGTAIGGWGASIDADGTGPARSLVHGDTLEVPCELQEALYPLRMEGIALATDSAGPGRFRGGLGADRSYLVLADCAVEISFERSKCPPWGLQGGGAGAVGGVDLRRADGGRDHILKGQVALKPGDRVIIRSGGGGGFGAPHLREVAGVRADVENGYVSIEAARQDYGVVLGADLRIDEEETKELRKRMAADPAV